MVDFWEGKTDAPILVIKLSPERLEAERPAVSALLQRSFDYIMSLTPPANPKELRKDKIILIDDFNFYRQIPKFLEATELVRGSGGLIVALSQSIEGLRSKKSYGDEADGMLANFPNIIMLRSASPITAKWFSSQFGQVHQVRDGWGTSYGKEGAQGRNDERRAVENLVLDREFLNMTPPSPDDGVTCYLKTQAFGEEIKKVIPWEQIIHRHPPTASVDFSPLPPELQIPAPWSEERLQFLRYGIVLTPRNADETPSRESAFGEAIREFEEEIRRTIYDIGFDAIQRLIDPE